MHDSICAHSGHCRHGASSQLTCQQVCAIVVQSGAGMSGRQAMFPAAQQAMASRLRVLACTVSRILILSATMPGIAAASADLRAARGLPSKGHSLWPCSCSVPSTTVALRLRANCCSGTGACAGARGAGAGATTGPGLAAGTATGLLAALPSVCASGDVPAYERRPAQHRSSQDVDILDCNLTCACKG